MRQSVFFTLEYIITISVLILWHSSINRVYTYYAAICILYSGVHHSHLSANLESRVNRPEAIPFTMEYIIIICVLILWHLSINRVYTYYATFCILYSGVHHYHLRANLMARVSKLDFISLEFR